MPFDHFLEPDDPAAFSPEALDEMHAYLRALPHHRWPEGAYSVFASPEERDAAVALRLATGDDDYAHAVVEIGPSRVLVSVVGDRATDMALREFVEWVRQRWASTLYEGERPVPPEALTAFRYPP